MSNFIRLDGGLVTGYCPTAASDRVISANRQLRDQSLAVPVSGPAAFGPVAGPVRSFIARPRLVLALGRHCLALALELALFLVVVAPAAVLR